jgi:ADP-ribose pyrophosphatase
MGSSEHPLLPDADLRERGVSRSVLLAGDFLTVLRDQAQLPDGSLGRREFVVHPGAVMVVPLLDGERLVMERQYRYPVGRVVLEFPAGKLDAGEGSLACAQRELQEETGYSAREWAFAGVIHPVVSYSTEHIDVWFARGLVSGDQKLDAGEFLDVVTCGVSDLEKAVLQGQVTDAKTLVGLLWLQNLLSGRWSLAWLPADDPKQAQPRGPWAPSDPGGRHEGA